MKKSIEKVIPVVACFLLVMSIFCFWKGFDHKNNYYQSERYTSLNQYVYVGGDAYNYIINSNYFTGFMVLGASSALGAVMLVSVWLVICPKKDQTEVPLLETLEPITEKEEELL